MSAELTIRYEEAGVVVVEELAHAVLAASPTWTTVAFLSRERDKVSGEFGGPRVSLRRYKKRGGRFVVDKHFTLTTRAQALALQAALGTWLADGGLAGGHVDDTGGDDDEHSG
jgi:hypothetical protein